MSVDIRICRPQKDANVAMSACRLPSRRPPRGLETFILHQFCRLEQLGRRTRVIRARVGRRVTRKLAELEPIEHHDCEGAGLWC